MTRFISPSYSEFASYPKICLHSFAFLPKSCWRMYMTPAWCSRWNTTLNPPKTFLLISWWRSEFDWFINWSKHQVAGLRTWARGSNRGESSCFWKRPSQVPCSLWIIFPQLAKTAQPPDCCNIQEDATCWSSFSLSKRLAKSVGFLADVLLLQGAVKRLCDDNVGSCSCWNFWNHSYGQ